MRRDKKEVRSGQEAGFSAEPTRIDMQSSTRSLDETARQTSAGRRIVGVLASGLGRRSSSHYSPTDSPNSPSLLVRRQFAFPILAVLAVAALGLWLLLPGGALRAQDADTIEYPENGTDAVATFTAVDPEGEAIVWSLAGDDMGEFDIDDGVLTFNNAPDFEAPADANTDNTYEVTVLASDGGQDTTAMETVTIEVTNVEEPGTVMLDTLQPQVEILITATLTDPDNPDQTATPLTGLTWEWLRGQDVIAGATGATYTPMASDVGSVLTAKATYKDAEDADNNKTAEIESAYAVRAKPTTNTPPQYPLIAGSTAQTREVAENTPSGQNIGEPVVATDSGDVLTYSLSGTNETLFDLDRATGQLKTKGSLDREGIGSPFTRTVTVTATDPWGAPATSEVTITVTNVDEAPVIASVATTAISSLEGTTAAPLTLTTALETYTAEEPESQTMTWSLSGADAARFDIGTGELTFKAQPDFEDPGDAGQDNVYEVTVVVSDPARNSDELAVRVTVTNVEETGTITFSSLRPKAGIPLTASLTDPDGGVTDLEWAWSRSGTGTDFEDDDRPMSATYTPVAADIGTTLTATATYRDNSLAAGAADIPLLEAPSCNGCCRH